jgi:hypothetical protein
MKTPALFTCDGCGHTGDNTEIEHRHTDGVDHAACVDWALCIAQAKAKGRWKT